MFRPLISEKVRSTARRSAPLEVEADRIAGVDAGAARRHWAAPAAGRLVGLDGGASATRLAGVPRMRGRSAAIGRATPVAAVPRRASIGRSLDRPRGSLERPHGVWRRLARSRAAGRALSLVADAVEVDDDRVAVAAHVVRHRLRQARRARARPASPMRLGGLDRHMTQSGCLHRLDAPASRRPRRRRRCGSRRARSADRAASRRTAPARSLR